MRRYQYLQQIVAQASKDPLDGQPVRIPEEIKTLEAKNPPWYKRALCRGESTINFYPHPKESRSEAKAMCMQCTYKDACLELALNRKNELGIWGGLTERQRDMLRRVMTFGEANDEQINELIERLRLDDSLDTKDPIFEIDGNYLADVAS